MVLNIQISVVFAITQGPVASATAAQDSQDPSCFAEELMHTDRKAVFEPSDSTYTLNDFKASRTALLMLRKDSRYFRRHIYYRRHRTGHVHCGPQCLRPRILETSPHCGGVQGSNLECPWDSHDTCYRLLEPCTDADTYLYKGRFTA